MNDDIQYPIEDMYSVSRDLRSFLQTQWSQHTALFMTNHDSFSSLLKAIACVIPHGEGKVHELEHGLGNYHKQYQAAYAALYDLAEQIEKAAQAMHLTDQSIDQSFQNTSQ